VGTSSNHIAVSHTPCISSTTDASCYAACAAVREALRHKGVLPSLQASVRSQIFNVLLESEVGCTSPVAQLARCADPCQALPCDRCRTVHAPSLPAMRPCSSTS
jgi:hypothetical protein